MRFAMMFALAGVLAVPGMAMAQDDSGLGSDPMQQDPMHQEPSTTPPSSQQGSMGTGSDVRTGMPMGQTPQVDVFKNKDNFELRGTVASVDSTQNMITVQREQGLPPVQLQVAQGTDIKMDGKSASLQQIQAGNEVRARFNVAQNQPVAVELDAKQSKAQHKMGSEMNKNQGSGSMQP